MAHIMLPSRESFDHICGTSNTHYKVQKLEKTGYILETVIYN